jgi:hypothetical protein
MDLGGASVSGGGQERHGSDSRAPALSDALPFLEPEAGPVAPVAAARAGRVDLYA